VFTFYDLNFEILERQRNQIRKIRVTPLKGKAPAGTTPAGNMPAGAKHEGRA
jgi:hypothetical protein